MTRKVIALKVEFPYPLTPKEITRLKADIMLLENAGIVLEIKEPEDKTE